MPFKLLSSPLQGFTDFTFRNAQQKFFGGIDTFYAPYIRLNGKDSLLIDHIPELGIMTDIHNVILRLIQRTAKSVIGGDGMSTRGVR